MKKLAAIVLAIMMLCSCVSVLAEAPEGYPEVKEGVDFGGKTIYIYDYWSTSSDEHKAEPTEEEQAMYDYRDWIMKTYNCHITQVQDGDWGSNPTQMMNFVSAPDGSYRIYVIEPGSVMNLVNNGYCMPWDLSQFADAEDDKWNDADIDFMTVGGKVYGVATGASEPRQCMFFNKRILAVAGIGWNEIYDLQANGTWTWAKFEEILSTVQKDTDNDGVIDIYGMSGNTSDMEQLFVHLNGGSFFEFNEEGKLLPTMNSDATLEALNFVKKLYDNYYYVDPDSTAWNYWIESFKAGKFAFLAHQTYDGFNDTCLLDGMEDDWGCVAYPVPQEGGNYLTMISDNINLIPNVYNEEEASMLSFLFDLWTNATPGFDDEDGWIGNKYNKVSDDRAVDETYAMLRQPEHCCGETALYLGTINDVLGQPLFWNISWQTPAESIEAAMPTWEGLCNDYNNK